MARHLLRPEREFLAEIAAERSARNPLVPARMRTAPSATAPPEAGEIDAPISTIDRFVGALKKRVAWRVVGGAP